MAACAVMLLGACEPTNHQTISEPKDATGPTPTLHPVNAATQEKIDTLMKRQDDLLNTKPILTLTPSPTPEG